MPFLFLFFQLAESSTYASQNPLFQMDAQEGLRSRQPNQEISPSTKFSTILNVGKYLEHQWLTVDRTSGIEAIQCLDIKFVGKSRCFDHTTNLLQILCVEDLRNVVQNRLRGSKFSNMPFHFWKSHQRNKLMFAGKLQYGTHTILFQTPIYDGDRTNQNNHKLYSC